MPNTTTNYNLTKPLETERYDVQVFNNNADIIDAAMKTHADNISNVASKVEQLNNWTTVEFTLADFTYDENSGVTYLRTEAPSGYEIEEIRGYFVLNKRELDSSTTNMVVIDMTKPQYTSELHGTIISVTHERSKKGLVGTLMVNINLDLLYSQSILTYGLSSSAYNWANMPIMNSVVSCAKSIAQSGKFETTSFTLKTNVPYTNISEFYGRLQYRVVPAPELTS